ncbi:MAG TPA: hypothetical protein VIK78_01030 [Ruminiclostridium sp.]
MEDTYLKVSFTTEKDDEANALQVYGSLDLINIETNESKLVGHALLYIFNEFMVDSWNELIDNADSISGDVVEVIDVLYSAKENEEIYGLIAVLDHIEILKEYRKIGYSNELLDKILDYLEYIGITYVGLIPARIYDNKVVENEKNAIQYYISKGFKPIARKVGEKVVMGKSLL